MWHPSETTQSFPKYKSSIQSTLHQTLVGTFWCMSGGVAVEAAFLLPGHDRAIRPLSLRKVLLWLPLLSVIRLPLGCHLAPADWQGFKSKEETAITPGGLQWKGLKPSGRFDVYSDTQEVKERLCVPHHWDWRKWAQPFDSYFFSFFLFSVWNNALHF